MSSSFILKKLEEENVISKERSLSVAAKAKSEYKKEEEILLEEEVVSEKDLFSVKSKALNVPLKEDLFAGGASNKVIQYIPEETAKTYSMIPIGEEGEKVEIGMVYPENIKAKEALDFLAYRHKFKYDTYLIKISDFNKLFKQYQTLEEEVGSAIEKIEKDDKAEEKKEEESETAKEFRELAEEAPVVRMVGVIIRQAVEGDASDIHIEPSKEKLKIRFRVSGKLYSSLFLPMKIHPAIVARIKILSGLRIDERRLSQDGRFSTNIDGKNIDFRVSTLPTTEGEKVVIRVLDSEKAIMEMEELGLAKSNLESAKKAVAKPNGIILVTGPTGSGKTTTLYSLLKSLNQEGVNIITLEDPVEYYMEGVNQSQVKPDIGYTFAKGLRQILRQDPDIIMVGEIRDEETAELAIHAALTGHIVLSTLHTNSATGAVPRLIDMGIKTFLISPSLNCVMAQRLVAKLCPHCRKEVTAEKDVEKFIKEELSKNPSLKTPSSFKLYKPVGCNKCGDEGYNGRIGIFEVMNINEDLQKIISENPDKSSIEKNAQKMGMINMRQDGIYKALEGLTTIEEVIKATKETE